jgi:hypothetical protein
MGAYVKKHGATVSAFYLSNVESYLQREGSWRAFCANVATFPLDDASLFIRPSAIRNTAQQAQLQATGTFTLVSGRSTQGAQILNFVPVRTTISATAGPLVDSAALVPPRSTPQPQTVMADGSMLPAGLVPIRGDVSACASPSR